MGQAWDGKDITARAEKRQQHRSQDPTAWSENGGHKSAAAAAGRYDLSPRGMRAFQEWTATWATEAMRVLKPGGHLVSFASPRTYHRMVCGIEEAGYEIRDQIDWMFGQGFPKSLNLCRCKPHVPTQIADQHGWFLCGACGNPYELGTGLKPAHEPICLARKPLDGTVAENVAKWGTGALNIEGCRVDGADSRSPNTGRGGIPARHNPEEARAAGVVTQPDPAGRWPANVLHDGSDDVIAAFPQGDVSYVAPSDKTSNVYGRMHREGEPSADSDNEGVVGFKMKPGARRLDSGSAARFFYCPKASKRDRDEGLESFEIATPTQMTGGRKEGSAGLDNPRAGAGRTSGARNSHPTVKPTALMQYLVRLVTPRGGMVLDPFMGSGSTGKACALEGMEFVGIELDSKWASVADARIKVALTQRAPEERAA
jgi:hypothetical protein